MMHFNFRGFIVSLKYKVTPDILIRQSSGNSFAINAILNQAKYHNKSNQIAL